MSGQPPAKLGFQASKYILYLYINLAILPPSYIYILAKGPGVARGKKFEKKYIFELF